MSAASAQIPASQRDEPTVPLKKFVSELHAVEFADETSLAAIQENRTTLCNMVQKQTGAECVCIWISYHDAIETRHFCYYSNLSEIAALSSEHKAVAHPNDTPDVTVETLIAKQLCTIVPNSAVSVRSYPAKNIFHETGLKASRNLGWISIAGAKEPHALDVVGTTAAIVLSHQIDRGRISRIRSARNDFSERLRKSSDISNAIDKTCDFISSFASFSTVLILDRAGQVIRFRGEGDQSAYTKFATAFTHDLNNDPAVGSEPVRPFRLRINNGSPELQTTGPTNSLRIQLRVAGFTFAEQKFQPVWQQLGLVEHRVPHSTFLLLDRRDAIHFGDISPTELEVCRLATRELETYISNRQFEAGISTIDDYLRSLDPTNPLDEENITHVVNSISPSIVGIFPTTYDISKSDLREEYFKANPGRTPLPKSYLARLKETAAKYEATHRDRYPDEARMGFALDDGRVFLEFHLSNAYEPVRYYAFEFGSNAVTRDELRLFRYLATELGIRLRNTDSAQERKTLFAQIRHAIVDPVAAAANSLMLVQREARYGRRNPDAWPALKNNELFFDCIEKAIYLTNQAKMLVETGRYLFSNLRFADLRTDHYDILKLVRRVLAAFSHQMHVKKMIPKLTVKGKEVRSMTGDSLLLWVALANLVDNGIKYGRSGSILTVALEFRSHSYLFKITNSGPYLSHALKEKLFTPYVRGPQPDTLNKKHGTGIGLPVTAMILSAHAPSAALDYHPEHTAEMAQTTFFFEMPYKIGRGRNPDGPGV